MKKNKLMRSQLLIATTLGLALSFQAFAKSTVTATQEFHRSSYDYQGETIKTFYSPGQYFSSSSSGDFIFVSLMKSKPELGIEDILKITVNNKSFQYSLPEFVGNEKVLAELIDIDLAYIPDTTLFNQFKANPKGPTVLYSVSPGEGAACLVGAAVAGAATGGVGASIFAAVCLKVADDNSIVTD